MLSTDPLKTHFRLSKSHETALRRLGITTVRDLLYHFPVRYETVSDVRDIGTLKKGDEVVLYGTLAKLETKKTWKSRVPITQGYVEDASGRLKVIWFHQPYIAKMHPEGSYVKLSGKIAGSEKDIYLASPKVENATPGSGGPLFGEQNKTENKDGAVTPVYPETRGVTSLWFYHALKRIFESGLHEELPDPVPPETLERFHLPKLSTALLWIHAPKKEEHAAAARKRFAFEEIFYIQLAGELKRRSYEQKKAFEINVDRGPIKKFMERFPFLPTGAQKKAIEVILTDFEKGHPMARLLEGDVGSGKTAVAASTVYAVATTPPKGQNFGNLQTAYMVPTEILAKQHFESFIEYFAHLPIQIGLITSSGCRKFPSKVEPTEATDISRTQLLKWVANGEIPILIGTHALIEKAVKFKNLAFVIIDEQHRFGTVQRRTLTRKDEIMPHLLSMTATPIPRTLALTIYGDLDLTLLDEMPAGRKSIITEVVMPNERTATYEKVRKELKNGRQAYVICPRIDEPDPEKLMALNAKSVTEEARRLSKDIFTEFKIDILHGKLTPSQKEEAMGKFSSGETDILVATSVVEVGVNVPNATVIVIEGAERFGLSQLHQLRGRVIRSTHQAYCYVFSDTRGPGTRARLEALTRAKNGFELSEEDLKIRGPGELTGRSQSGISDVGMEAIRNLKLVEAARNEAQALLKKDPTLSKLPEIRERVLSTSHTLHFE